MILTSKRPIGLSFGYDNFIYNNNDNNNNDDDDNEIEYNLKKRIRISQIYYDNNNSDIMPLNSMFLTNDILSDNIGMNIEENNGNSNSNSNDEYRTTTINMSTVSSNNLKPKLTDYFKPISNQSTKIKQFFYQEIIEHDTKCEYCNIVLHDLNEMSIDNNNTTISKTNREQNELNSIRCSFCNRLCCNNTSCISLCEKCGYKYCKFCCTLNYDDNYERLLCIDCNLD